MHQIPWDLYEEWARAQWAAHKGPDAPRHLQYKEMAAIAGYGPHRVIQQKRKGGAPLYAVRDYARGLGIDPVAATAAFTPMTLLDEQGHPAPREWSTQLHAPDFHAELLRRLGHPVEGEPRPDSFVPRPVPWATALFDGPLNQPPNARGRRRKHAAELLEITYSTLYTKQQRGSWNLLELHKLCQWTGWNFALALGITGWFTWDELGLNPGTRHSAIRELAHDELIAAIDSSLPETLVLLEIA